jgi:hypothetical protein
MEELYNEEAEMNAVYCDMCGVHHTGPCEPEDDHLEAAYEELYE